MHKGNIIMQRNKNRNGSSVLVFDTHPIQYKVPIYRGLGQMFPGQVEVVYASGCSVHGFEDPSFRGKFAWDVLLLDDYRYRILVMVIFEVIE